MTPTARAVLRTLLAAACFASGVAGLAYEVVWQRLLAVVLGNASFATAAVLAAVMGGMGAGAWLAGRVADRVRPLALYGALELGLGASALAVPALAAFAADASVEVLRAVGPGWPSFAARFAIAGGVLLAPSLLLGATLPALARATELALPRGPDRVGRGVAIAYALNTAGAALGCVLTGYVLLAAWGVRATSSAAAAVDLAVGALALALALSLGRALRPGAPPRDVPAPGPAPGPAVAPLPRGWLLALAFTSGAVLLGLETVWTRLFLVVFGHDVHAFSAMLASVLLGLALGAALGRVAPARVRAHAGFVPALFGALGACALAALAFVGRRYLAVGLDVIGLDAAIPFARSELRGMALQAALAAVTVLPAAVVAGAIFPALAARHPARAAGRGAGDVLAASTAGSLVGPLLTPLALVPALGVQGAAIALSGLAATAGGLAALRFGGARRRVLAGALVAATALTALAAPSGLPRRMLAQKIGPAHLDFEVYREGRSATVAVVRNRIHGERQLFVNGINEVTTRLVHDQSFALLGHLGPLLSPRPARVAVICLGAGLAAGAVAQHGDVEEITIVDLEPAVVAGAERFRDLNHDVLDDPRVRLVFDDGRAHLRTTRARYDVIVLDSTHPRAVDSWLLYTRELYRTARARLADGGILVQWLPLHGLSTDEFRILVGTFRETFDDATLWTNVGFEPYGQVAYSLLVGGRGALRVEPDRIALRAAEPRVEASLARWGLAGVAEILECLHAGPDTLARWTEGLPVATDDHPIPSFVTAFTRAAPMTPDRLLEAFEPPEAQLVHLDPALALELDRRWRSQAFLLHGELARAAERCAGCAKPPMFEAAMRQGPGYYRALGARYRGDRERALEVAAGLALHGLGAEAIATLEHAARAWPDDVTLHVNLGVARALSGDDEGALEAYREALRVRPRDPLARLGLGNALLALGSVDAAVIELERAVASAPSFASAHAGLGRALAARPGDGERAERALSEALALDPRHRDARAALGALRYRAGRWDEAAQTLREGTRYHPLEASLWFDLAQAERRAGRAAEARASLDRVLAIDPDDDAARAARAALP
ncbi:MAG: fused MFS/spermidine synthase [Sandaracinaceae bacterium]|nr:fused MFS/spermidine synthase [Sandaracinaceae bacterium]